MPQLRRGLAHLEPVRGRRYFRWRCLYLDYIQYGHTFEHAYRSMFDLVCCDRLGNGQLPDPNLPPPWARRETSCNRV